MQVSVWFRQSHSKQDNTCSFTLFTIALFLLLWITLNYTFNQSCLLTVPAAPSSCNITLSLSYNQSSGRLLFINSTWNTVPVTVSHDKFLSNCKYLYKDPSYDTLSCLPSSLSIHNHCHLCMESQHLRITVVAIFPKMASETILGFHEKNSQTPTTPLQPVVHLHMHSLYSATPNLQCLPLPLWWCI